MESQAAMVEKVQKTEAEWKAQLTSEQYRVARKKGTERAFTGDTWDNHAKGTYRCVCCGTPLFASDTKFDSGTGWPSFWQPIDKDNVREEDDSGRTGAHRPALLHELGGDEIRAGAVI
jgi:peptide-methionine (R)-S-oxide reductase